MADTASTPAFVLLIAGDEIGRYTTKGSANRAGRKLAVEWTVLDAASYDADLQARAEADRLQARLADEAAYIERMNGSPADAVVEAAEEVVKAESVKAKRAPAAASRKLATPQKRVLSGWVQELVMTALEGAFEEETTEDNEDDVYLPALLGASADDIRTQVQQWMSYLPQAAADETV